MARLLRRTQYRRQLRAMVIEPSLVLTPRGTALRHQPPEPPGVVHLSQVCHLMDHNIVHHRLRRHDQPPIEAKGASVRTTAPARPLPAYREPVVLDAEGLGRFTHLLF